MEYGIYLYFIAARDLAHQHGTSLLHREGPLNQKLLGQNTSCLD